MTVFWWFYAGVLGAIIAFLVAMVLLRHATNEFD